MADGAGPRFDIAGLDILYQRLASAGFKVGPAGQSRANLLLLEFIARDALPDDAADLARWLQPIFVTRSEDRARFFETVLAWSRSARHVDVAPEEQSQQPNILLPPRDWDDRPATPPPVIVPWWRRVPGWAWSALVILTVFGGLAAAPQVRSYIWSVMFTPAPLVPMPVPLQAPIESVESAERPIQASAPDQQQQTAASLEQLVASIDARADVYGGAPSLRELYAATPAIGGEPVIPLPGDPDTVADAMGFSADRPLPLTRTEVMRRLLIALHAGGQFERADRASSVEELLTGGGERGVTIAFTGDVYDVSFSADGTQLLTAGERSPAQLWNSADGRRIRSFDDPEQGTFSAAFSPDGRRIVTARWAAEYKIWDTRSGVLISTVVAEGEGVVRAAFSPDGLQIVTAGFDDTARVRNASDGRLIGTMLHDGDVNGAVFSPDGAHIVTVSADSTGRVWDSRGFRLVANLTGHEGEIWAVSYSPDGSRIVTASADGTARVWGASDWQVIRTLAANGGGVTSAVFSPDGALVSTVSTDVLLWDVESGRQLGVITAHGGQSYDVAFAPAGDRMAIASTDNFVRVLRPLVLVAEPIADEMQRRALTKAQLGDRVRAALQMPDYVEPNAEAEAQLSPADREALIEQRARSASDDDIARAWALLSFDTGWPLNITDPPWLRPEQHRQPDPLRLLKDNANWIAAGLVALAALVLWFWSALNARGFLARRRPDDTGRVADLAAEDRSKAERADQSLRIAARRLLERRESTRALDLAASVDATARAGGFFTPISRAHRRIPEYLFLIDSRSRFDHDAKRALDYVERLRKENVKADFYYFERAPDRVREDIGRPLVPLETITSQHATRRLVVVGDAAAMLESDGRTVGRWADTVRVWEDRALMTTVPVSEWGEEESRVAGALDMLVRPLSASALAHLPTELRNETDVQRQAGAANGLGERPLPAMLREAPHIWTLESQPAPADIDRMLAELHAFLGQHGFRWLSACAVYPAIEWDLTMALGWRLKEGEQGDERPLVTEQRTALISELPWMRAGAMPQWLRERLLDEMSPQDRQTVRAFLGELLDSARNAARSPRDAITLSFSVEGGRGRDLFDDDVFVQFLLEDPKGRDARALEATKKVRELLLPPLSARLMRPAELAVLLSGLVLAVAAWQVAPRFNDAPLPTGAWAPLAALALAPLLLWTLRKPVGGAWSTLWSAFRNPRGAWDDWRTRVEARKVMRDTDRLAYLRLIAPLLWRWAIGTRSTTLTGLAAGVVGALIGIGAYVARESLSALRSNLGESYFTLSTLCALGVTAVVLIALARLAHLFTRRSAAHFNPAVAASAPSPAGTWVFFGLSLLALVSAGIATFAVTAGIAFGGPAWSALAGAAGFALFVLAVGERISDGLLGSLNRRIQRLELGLEEEAQRVEITIAGFGPSVRSTGSSRASRSNISAADAAFEFTVLAAGPLVPLARALERQGLKVERKWGGERALIVHSEAGDSTLPLDDLTTWRGDVDAPDFQSLLKAAVAALREGAQAKAKPLEPRHPYAYVSHATADNPRIRPVILALLDAGIPLWFDKPNHPDIRIEDERFAGFIHAGRAWSGAIEDSALPESSAFLIFPSAAALDSQAAWHEVASAMSRWRTTKQRYFIAPLFLEDVAIRQMHDEIDSFQGYRTHVEQTAEGWMLTSEGAVETNRLATDLRARFQDLERSPLTTTTPPPQQASNPAAQQRDASA